MNKVAQLWTAGIAYVALAVGAGLSIMYNVVDTMAVRGQALDIYDVVTAVAAPGVVVLMVEMFVSRWWVGQRWYMQLVRVASVATIGGVAMRTSWTHGHDFMLRRGQAEDVATLWPLAIDLLAIMATALILAGRRVANVATDVLPDGTVLDIADGQVVGIGRSVDMDNPMATYATVSDEAESYLARLANHPDLDTTTTPAVPVAMAKLPQRQSVAKRSVANGVAMDSPKVDMAEALDLAKIGVAKSDYTLGQISELLGGHYGVSARTIRRQSWWPTVSGRPISGAPSV